MLTVLIALVLTSVYLDGCWFVGVVPYKFTQTGEGVRTSWKAEHITFVKYFYVVHLVAVTYRYCECTRCCGTRSHLKIHVRVESFCSVCYHNLLAFLFVWMEYFSFYCIWRIKIKNLMKT